MRITEEMLEQAQKRVRQTLNSMPEETPNAEVLLLAAVIIAAMVPDDGSVSVETVSAIVLRMAQQIGFEKVH